MHINKLLQPSVGADLSRTPPIYRPFSVDDIVSAFKSYSALSALDGCSAIPINKLRHGSNERDSASPTARSSPVILSAAKHLAAARDRPFAEFTLSEAHGLRVTRGNCSNWHGLFFTLNLA